MKTLDWISQNIGNKAIVSGDGDLGFSGELRSIIFNKTELTIVKLTRGGKVYLTDGNDRFYTVPPRNIKIIETPAENG
jgi:hypothetical protein